MSRPGQKSVTATPTACRSSRLPVSTTRLDPAYARTDATSAISAYGRGNINPTYTRDIVRSAARTADWSGARAVHITIAATQPMAPAVASRWVGGLVPRVRDSASIDATASIAQRPPPCVTTAP